ncbi:MAG: KEOPS complex subunit Pcc1 [Thermoplasmatota archaeon]
MSHRLRLRIPLGDAAEAARAVQALMPDNGGFASASQEGHYLVVELESTSVMGLWRGAEDVLRCVQAVAAGA